MLVLRFTILLMLVAVLVAKKTGHRKQSKPMKRPKDRLTWPKRFDYGPKTTLKGPKPGDSFIVNSGSNRTKHGNLRLSAGPECGAFILPSDAEGILYSVNDKSALECLTEIESPAGTTMQMVCPHFDLNPKGCKKEQLLARDPTREDLIVEGCKREGLTFTTTSNNLQILHIRKKIRGKQCTGGFMCSISVGRAASVTGKCGKYSLEPDHFTVLFSNNNGGKRRCKYKIKGAADTNLQMICPVLDFIKSCKKEKLILKDNTSRKKKNYCFGDEIPDLTLKTNSAQLTHIRKPLKKKCSGGFLCFVGAEDSGSGITVGPPNPPGPLPPSSRPFCSDCGIADISIQRIVGGQEATAGEYPFIALLKFDGSVCGGSLIKKQWVVTAAHCFVMTGATSVEVFLAAHDFSNVDSDPNVQRFDTSGIFIHPNYDEVTQDNDIALVNLGREAVFNDRVQPICLGTANDIVTGDKVVTAGWGVLQSGSQTVSDTLQEVAVDLISSTKCTSLYQNTFVITENMICALTTGKDACQGDSGGPLVKQTSDGRWALVGAVSFGEGCAMQDKPGVYTKLPNYIDWITTTSGGSSC